MSQQVIFTGAKLFIGIDESVIENGTIWLDGNTLSTQALQMVLKVQTPLSNA